MHTPSSTRLGAHSAPRAIEAIQVGAGTALLTSVCLLLATIMVPDLVLRGPAAQLASPSALAALLLLTASTVLLERELIVHGLIIEEPVDAHDTASEPATPVAVSAAANAGVRVITLPDTATVHLAGSSDPPEPVAEPIDDDPWWAPWMEQGSRSVFDPDSQGGTSQPVVIDLSDDTRADQLAGAAVS